MPTASPPPLSVTPAPPQEDERLRARSNRLRALRDRNLFARPVSSHRHPLFLARLQHRFCASWPAILEFCVSWPATQQEVCVSWPDIPGKRRIKVVRRWPRGPHPRRPTASPPPPSGTPARASRPQLSGFRLLQRYPGFCCSVDLVSPGSFRLPS